MSLASSAPHLASPIVALLTAAAAVLLLALKDIFLHRRVRRAACPPVAPPSAALGYLTKMSGNRTRGTECRTKSRNSG
jgi:hypothetical protein